MCQRRLDVASAYMLPAPKQSAGVACTIRSSRTAGTRNLIDDGDAGPESAMAGFRARACSKPIEEELPNYACGVSLLV